MIKEQILSCYQHVTPISIARMLGVSYNKVYLTLLNEGINVEPTIKRKRKSDVIEIENKVRACVGHLTAKSIAKVLNISYEMVQYYLTKKFDINYVNGNLHRRNPNFVSQVKPKVEYVRRFKYKNSQLI